MSISKHCADRLRERAGINPSLFSRMVRGKNVPDGEFECPGIGTLIVKNNVAVTLLGSEMTVVRS